MSASRQAGSLPLPCVEDGRGVVLEQDDPPSPRPRIGGTLAAPPYPKDIPGGQEPAPAKAGAAVMT